MRDGSHRTRSSGGRGGAPGRADLLRGGDGRALAICLVAEANRSEPLDVQSRCEAENSYGAERRSEGARAFSGAALAVPPRL